LHINNCGLKEISREDLVGLENLQKLFLHRNLLTSLPSDLLIGMKNLQDIGVARNKLEFFSGKLLEPIAENELELVDLQFNTNISTFYVPGHKRSVASLQELMDVINEKCSKLAENETFKDDIAIGLKELWDTGRYSDFTIIGGSGKIKEFKMHKCVLAVQSSVFAALFEKCLSELKITDFSADVIRAMLHFIYTGTIDDKTEVKKVELYSIAAKHDIPKLKTLAHELTLRNIDEFNAFKVFTVGHSHNSFGMKYLAFKQIKKMFPNAEFDDSLMDKPEQLKKLVEACRARKRKMEEAEMEYKRVLNECKEAD
jgi:BTB/POZ domain/Leucine rich repeat